ncbi:MAG: type III pantothenate kinase [Pirellulales bacterium]|nr:type III pantothenate kinase [Pirellulales bacterium]
MREQVVAVDVGNTAIKLCFDQQGSGSGERGSGSRERGVVEHSVRIDQPDWDRAALQWVNSQLGELSVQWRIASVHRPAADRLEQTIEQTQAGANIRRITRHDVPMRVRVDHPDQLGIDRLLGAHAAYKRFESALVVVDAGSAVTVDWVDAQGEFHGGAILPGLTLQFGALASGTDALPQIDFRDREPLQIPGRNTVAAIRLGVLTTIAAGIEHLAHTYALQRSPEARESQLILTGGDAAVISPLLGQSHRVAPNLVCRGLLDLPRLGPSATNSPRQVQ